MPITRLERPFRPIELGADTLASFHLLRLADELRSQEEYPRAGVAAVTLARDDHLTLVLVALRAGSTMREHRAPSAGSVVVLTGRVAFVTGRDPQRTELAAGSLIAFSADLPHGVEALEDAAYLVAIGGRDRPHAGS
jgi:quercetin dioxygenase-like cupin family protein